MKATKAHRLADPTVTKETHAVTPLRRLTTRIASFRTSPSIPVSSNSTPATRDDSATRGAAMASAGPSDARTPVGGVAALLTRLRTQHRAVSAAASVLAIGAGAFIIATPAQAATPSPGWSIRSVAQPTNFSASDNSNCESNNFCDSYTLLVTNTGSQATDGSTITIADNLPPGLTVTSISGEDMARAAISLLTCTTAPLQCTSTDPIAPDDVLQVTIDVEVTSATGTLTNSATVSGGGAPAAATSAQNSVSSAPSEFGVTDFSFGSTGLDGASYAQAGGHPYEQTTTVELNTNLNTNTDSSARYLPAHEPKNIVVDLPQGFVGNPQTAATCPLSEVLQANINFDSSSPTFALTTSACPNDSQVGVVTVHATLFSDQFGATVEQVGFTTPLYNVTPENGHPAEFGFNVLSHAVFLYPSVIPTPTGYTLRVVTPGIPRGLGVSGVSLTLFGNPKLRDGDPNAGAPFLTNPVDCGSPMTAKVFADSWVHPGRFNPDGSPDLSDPAWKTATSTAPPPTGCNRLSFDPTLSVQPDTSSADSASGLAVNLGVPQASGELATPELKKAVVTLPPGMAVNPSAADGLGACSPAQIALGSNTEPTCPDSSKIGTVELQTPLLDHTLNGSIYVATQNDNPFNSLLAGYIVVDDPATGVLIKIPGNLTPDPQTGQITAVFDNNPQFPFSDLKLHFFGGARGDLTTPPSCGTYQTTSELTPWSAPDSGPPATPSDAAAITSGPGGGACPDPSHLSPSLSAGTVSPLAGTYSPFVFRLARENGSARIAAIDATLPPGLVGKLAGIPYCSAAAIAAAASKSGSAEKAAPSCPLASEVGTVNVGAGSGTPFYVQGHAYLAGPYKGAPLSLAIVTPAVAGPFDLGTVVVRTALYVNETTAQIHAVSDPIPTILAGIPLDVRSIALNMNRPQFTLNPTSCNAMAVLGAATSTLGQTASLSDRFQVGACNALGFKPSVALSLKGSTKRAGNPALRATVTYPKKGSYANIARAQVTLPKSEFLDNAHIRTVCTRVQFAAAPGNGSQCPAASVYGHARAITPLLDKPLEGPVYLRSSSHKLPDLVAALNGQINVALAGKIDTGKSGGIRNTFEVVPDAPVTKFTLEMKGGKKGLLVNSENICAKPQRAVAKFTAQNGKVDDYNPLIANSCKVKGKKHGKGKHHHRGKR